MTDTDSKRKLEAALNAARATVSLLEAELAASPVRNDSNDLVPLRKCGLSVRTARAAIKRGELVAFKVGRDLMLRPADLVAFQESRRVKPSEPRPRFEREQTAAARAIDRARLSGSLRVVGGGQ